MRFAKAFKMATGPVLDGVFGINKPMGMSSAQVIRDCQSVFNPSSLFATMLQEEKALRDRESKYQHQRRKSVKKQLQVKMGHGGTLDPLATGVLILGVGKGTKTLQNFLMCTKTYEAVVLFGASTDSYDRVGRLVKKGQYDEVTRPAVEEALKGFRGKFKQVPPLYSALKMEGKPLYEYAREGKPIPREIDMRDVEVTELEIVEWYEPGTHNHRWPTEEAGQAEKNLVDSVWRVARRQTTDQTEPEKLTPEQEAEETRALAEYQSSKRAAEERVDGLVREGEPPSKRKKVRREPKQQDPPMMSGALGTFPPAGRGSNLVPPPPSADTPPPWEGKGPPAVKIRMTVTSGFYVRSLCHDLGEKLGSGALMAELVRTRQGEFALGQENCLEYDDILKGEEVWSPKVQRALSLWQEAQARPGASSSGNGLAAVNQQAAPAQEEEKTAGDKKPQESVEKVEAAEQITGAQEEASKETPGEKSIGEAQAQTVTA
ncbi:pseudouridine synthase [Echria macrotheca]|uniref:tRNA pseudouridine(55) synthase n=1 Tax=Echria macrotheca TaxID=438768 RepID=A0AAJ0FEZ5_9PEZI|nr:pseudouridine synthase [Echria macrotheca]